ncbi:MAG: hypothetical protein DI536_07365 [Archangium gephyra]|uniref:Uncharacterized protein n=1 Tax=Archangium gephyra TaxID=48 RepID=A0A2W5VJH1_9BACT|nr:MAG: hypothetical protein DI536_07365 [Archangium gephyra]
MSGAPHPFLDELIAFATPEETKPDLLEARAAWFQRTGEVFEEDRQIELRMSGFLEHYCCDRVAPHFGKTPAREFYERALKQPDVKRAAALRSLTETVHSLFEVEKISNGEVRVVSLFGRITRDVTERRHIVGLKEGDVLEARLIPFDGPFFFSPSYCFHPHEAAELIKAEAARLLAAGAVDEAAFVQDCAQRSLKVDRYRQIAVERIYDFANKKI